MLEEIQNGQLEIVRTKRLSLKPMDSEEAVLQMNMLGHNFFIFEDADTNGTSIVYRRKDGKFGLIETDGEVNQTVKSRPEIIWSAFFIGVNKNY